MHVFSVGINTVISQSTVGYCHMWDASFVDSYLVSLNDRGIVLEKNDGYSVGGVRSRYIQKLQCIYSFVFLHLMKTILLSNHLKKTYTSVQTLYSPDR